ATPAIALGAADATPIEVAAAYPMFANRGIASRAQWVSMVRSNKGELVYEGQPARKSVLDPRVNYLMVSLMEEVIRTGTAAGVRGRGFTLPAAGKTGTSRDGWFAGFTSKLVCAVWVGFDDSSDLGLEGSKSALPVWAEFMKRAHQHREYRNVHGWDAPDGIVSVDVDPSTGQLATAGCPSARAEVFISGTQPVELCRLHGGGGTQVTGWETATASHVPRPAAAGSSVVSSTSPPVPGAPAVPSTPDSPSPGSRKGLFGKIRDVFR
ncbi:MAG TPA: penicillin-binding transpeptidase domain-containing protein, partial [Bryobacteraceae bacterium]|nr:penicillin-binding transpeptidase domain-containing protein [Bryobacteraceae bacterium]